jgi:uncharacterized protein YuzE
VAAQDRVLAELTDPDGRSVVLLARIWENKITREHPELRDHLDQVVGTVAEPDHAEPDPRAQRRSYYRRRVGPSRWLLVVVSFEQRRPDHHSRGDAQGPQAMEAVDIKIGPLVFDKAEYDPEGDVLYLHVGVPQEAEGEETPEGHVLRFEPGTQRIIGLTVINARWLLDRDGRLTVTIPETVEASADELAPALTAA